MESLAPPLTLLLAVKGSLEMGHGVRYGVLQSLDRLEGDFLVLTKAWISLLNQGAPTLGLFDRKSSIYRKHLFVLLEQGVKGVPIYEKLRALELEMVEACQSEIREHLERLPLKILLPILVFQFPAFLILLFGPLLNHLKNH